MHPAQPVFDPAHAMGLPTDSPLVLGPMLRYVGETSATVWAQTAEHSVVTVTAGDREWSAPTFRVREGHYALVVADGLPVGSDVEYQLRVDGRRVWPEPDSPYPHPRLRTLDHDRPTRLAFGSCRVSEPHDARANKKNGVDALRTLALALVRGDEEWPDLMAFLGDQVYADWTSDEMRDFIASKRDIDEDPGVEIKDYEEYAHLYWLAWSDPANRWLLSTLPSCMIFDDHDIRDDWNTSWTWHEQINRTRWWHDRLVGGLASYWVYQHIGNLAPDELAADEIYARVLEHAAARDAGPSGMRDQDELDLTDAVFDLVERVDRHPEVYRWSYRRDLGDCRLVVVDSRAARVLEPERRSMLDEQEQRWLDEQLTGDVDHLLIGTSLPFLLPPGLHDFEAIDEVTAQGAYGRPLAAVGEKIRQVVDLEHWAAFNDGFEAVFDMVMDVARGNRGRAPATVTFLSGDVHNSYVAHVTDAAARHGARSTIVQAVCSPIRNPMPMALRVLMSGMAKSLVKPMNAWARRSKRVPDPAYPWTVTHGPWYDNCFAELNVQGPDLVVVWRGGEVRGGDDENPALTTVAEVKIAGSR
ncbi:alkaline phosphatase D family protein [Terracoccus luteus]|jgi:phosphodiesterase/alkaline phosphatase D-like protein|uniref:Phosphodiesterase/alkaline phosphatase D-like protein n=1 Tax=Terracoccus luteus TaxID=53356 RepID=A0A839PVA4_9MICO|nr:alkaline phosphatase D family protein [Terracoccus luteus]MBB2988050.1 phosphodiesterase/alkaline phosphatase D-like protein [Terracoccus luteus]MCP2173701.1 phosphodiesterase/alkaline phosphatase D-like protein [Terracoccus luteus]